MRLRAGQGDRGLGTATDDDTDVLASELGDDPESHQEQQFDKLEARLESMGLLPQSARRRGAPERDIILALGTADRPIRDPEGFEVAHRTLARGLEALLVNGGRSAVMPPWLGPLRPLVAGLVQFVANWIIVGQMNEVLKHVRRRYELREANAVWNSDEYRVLRRCRVQMQLLSDDLKSSVSLPVFLLGGAAVSGAISVLQSAADPVLSNAALAACVIAVLVVVLAAIAGAVLLAASLARRRLRLAISRPLAMVYDTLGSTGRPPEDKCFLVAVVGLVCFGLAITVIPIGVLIFLNVT